MQENTPIEVRKKAGRKPVSDKKVTLCIYPLSSEVDALGEVEAKDVALKAVQKAAKKIVKK